MFDDVILVSKHIQPIPQSEVDKLEEHFGFKFPIGYTTFIKQLGRGVYCDIFRIYSPAEILERYSKLQQIWGQTKYMSDENRNILNPEQLQKSIIIGDTIEGEELVFYPPKPDNVFILSRLFSYPFAQMKSDFSDLHEWEYTRVMTFESFYGRKGFSFGSEDFKLQKSDCLKLFRTRWDDGSLVVAEDDADEKSWWLLFYIPQISAQIHITKDEGDVHVEEGNYLTVYKTWLRITIYCDEENVDEIKAFIEELASQGWFKIKTRRF